MSDWPKNALPLADDPAPFPPYSKEQQDAEIEGLRFAFCELAAALHEAGTLDLRAVAGRLGNAEWLYQDSPQSLASVRWLADTLMYMRSKLGEPGGGQP